jgi:hypothetical protein
MIQSVPDAVIILLWMLVVFLIGAGMLLFAMSPFIVWGLLRRFMPGNNRDIVQSTLSVWRRRDQKRRGFPILQGHDLRGKQEAVMRLVLIAAICSIACGCTKTVMYKVVRLAPGKTEISKPVAVTSVYKVGYADEKKKYHSIGGTARLLNRGTPVGFTADEEGKLYAIAAEEMIPVSAPPGKTLVWYSREKEQTHFGKESEKAMAKAGVVAEGAAVAGVVVGTLAIEAELKELSQGEPQAHHRHRHHRSN